MSAFIHNKSFKKGKKKDKRSTTVLIDSAKGRLSEELILNYWFHVKL